MKTRFDYRNNNHSNVNEFFSFFHLGKPKIYNLIASGSVYVNNNPIKQSIPLKDGDIISIFVDEEIDFEEENGDIDVVYEDDYLLILNKPSGIIIHSEEKKNEGALCNLVANYYKKKNLHLNIRYAHRLDKETTGIIVFCKDPLTHSYMNYYISTHDIKREYRCLVQGKPKNTTGRINLPIGSDRHSSNKMVISKTGKEAITNYEVLYSYKGYSLLRVLLETGRTHQIRLHLSSIGIPLLGDTLYGGQKHYISRVALHSYAITFIHPVTLEHMTLTCDVAEDMKKLMRV